MSTLKVDTLQDISGNGLYPARAWGNLDMVGTIVIRGDENIASITDAGIGLMTVTWSSAAPNANYAVPAAAADHTAGSARFAMPGDGNTQTSTQITIGVDNTGSDYQDADRLHVSAFWT